MKISSVYFCFVVVKSIKVCALNVLILNSRSPKKYYWNVYEKGLLILMVIVLPDSTVVDYMEASVEVKEAEVQSSNGKHDEGHRNSYKSVFRLEEHIYGP